MYAEQQEDLTARFVAHGRKRRAYLETLIKAADGNLDMTWQEAHNRLPNADVPDQLSHETATERTTPVMV